MQYSRPGGNFFVGDCMPFAHDGVFHLYYLLDEAHHALRGGLGGHQWAHLSTTDLVCWTQHPLALALGQDWEASLCTGSILHYREKYHAFYPTRTWQKTECLSHASGPDGISFAKTLPNPFLSAPAGYAPADFRDPFAYIGDDGRVNLLVTARLEAPSLAGLGGCIVRFTSQDLAHWDFQGPILFPGSRKGHLSVPECPDYFAFNGRQYLTFGQGLRTYYRISSDGGASWSRPLIDTLGNNMLAVMKTASFGDGRRIGVAWIGSRDGGRDDGNRLWGGHLVFREIVPLRDGSLGTKFPAEMVPDTGRQVGAHLASLTPGAVIDAGNVTFRAPATIEAASLAELPRDYRLRCTFTPQRGAYRFGLGLRGEGAFDTMYLLSVSGTTGNVRLGDEEIEGVYEDGQPIEFDIVLHDDIIDVCINESHCLINRLGNLQGGSAFLFCEGGCATVSGIASTYVKRNEEFGLPVGMS
ncbi:MAG: hypothetical protein P4L33_20130 [Capsulimonadaceae bacterium]|nr:hypothetical protein [Capsulimonadaceae bacterium]